MPDTPPRPPIAHAPLSLVLLPPAGAGETGKAVAAWRGFLDTLNRPYEVLLVAPAESAPDPAVRVVSVDAPERLGEAVKTALREAQHPLVALATADEQFRPDELARLLALIDPVDIVVGCRVAGPVPAWRRALDAVIGGLSRWVLGIPLPPRPCWLGTEGFRRRWVARRLFGVRLHDPECPLRLVRREVLHRFPLQCAGPMLLVEMLAKANHVECIMTEEPVTWDPPRVPAAWPGSFAAEAWRLFREPDFTPVETHVSPAPAAPVQEGYSGPPLSF